MRLTGKPLELTLNLIKRMKDAPEASVSIEVAMSLVDTIEDLQQENEQLKNKNEQLRNDNINAEMNLSHITAEYEQLRAQAARMEDALVEIANRDYEKIKIL